ncbi:MAG: DUF4190 domain-containing protein [Lachnospira sp.]
MAVASLVLGICSLVIPGIGPILGIIGIVLGAMARKDPNQNQNLATAGLVCSIICCALSCISLISCIACGGCNLCATMCAL